MLALKNNDAPERVKIAASLDSDDLIPLFDEPTRMMGDEARGIAPEPEEDFKARLQLYREYAAAKLRYRYGDPDEVETLTLELRAATVLERERIENRRLEFKEKRALYPALFRANYRTDEHAKFLRAWIRKMLTALLVNLVDVDTKTGKAEDLDQAKTIKLLELVGWHEIAAMKLLDAQTPTVVQSLSSGP